MLCTNFTKAHSVCAHPDSDSDSGANPCFKPLSNYYFRGRTQLSCGSTYVQLSDGEEAMCSKALGLWARVSFNSFLLIYCTALLRGNKWRRKSSGESRDRRIPRFNIWPNRSRFTTFTTSSNTGGNGAGMGRFFREIVTQLWVTADKQVLLITDAMHVELPDVRAAKAVSK